MEGSISCICWDFVFHFYSDFHEDIAEASFLSRNIADGFEWSAATALPRDIHAAPPESFVAKLSEVIGNFSSMKKMVLFWCRIVAEVSILSVLLPYEFDSNFVTMIFHL